MLSDFPWNQAVRVGRTLRRTTNAKLREKISQWFQIISCDDLVEMAIGEIEDILLFSIEGIDPGDMDSDLLSEIVELREELEAIWLLLRAKGFISLQLDQLLSEIDERGSAWLANLPPWELDVSEAIIGLTRTDLLDWWVECVRRGRVGFCYGV